VTPAPSGPLGGGEAVTVAGRGHSVVTWLRQHRVWLLVTAAYLTVFPYSPGINNPNENVRIYMTRALVEHHELAIDKVEADWGWVNDKAKYGGHVFSGKAPGTSLLGVPVLALETWLWHRMGWRSPSKLATTLALRLFAVMVPMTAFLLAFSRHLRRVSGSQGVADLLLVAVGLGSLLYPYGIHFVGHSLAAGLSFGAFMVLTPSGTITRSVRRAALAGLLAGLGVLFEYQNILVAALLTIYVGARRPRLLGAFLLGTLPAAATLGLLHTLCFGRPWAFPYGHLENLEFQAAHHDGFYGVVWPAPAAMLGVLAVPGFGFFACSPFLIAATFALGWVIARGPRAEGILCAAVAIVLTLFVAGLPNWRGGWSVGPRYIAVVVPYLAVALAYAWPRVSLSRARVALVWPLTAGLVLVGVFLNALSAVIYPQYPTQLRNPAFELLVRLPLDGYVPYSLGYAAGLRGLPSLLPTALALAFAAIFALTPASQGRDGALPRRRLALPVAALVFIACVVPLSLWPARMSIAERDAIRVVEGTFTPRPLARKRD
jgi:hypothetical protein